MKGLRDFIAKLREDLGVPYPLAHARPLVSGKSLILKAQKASDLDADYRLVDDQLMLTYPGQSFVDRVTWEGGIAAGWRPDPNPDSTVLIRPDVRFGRPAVGGVSTATIYEQAEEGASRQEIADDFDLRAADVGWALVYEYGRHSGRRRAA